MRVLKLVFPRRRPMMVLAVVLASGALLTGCPSKDTTAPNYGQAPRGVQQPCPMAPIASCASITNA